MRYLTLALLLLLSACTSKSEYDFYRAPRRTQRHYHKRQRINERDRQRAQNLDFNPLGWLFPA